MSGLPPHSLMQRRIIWEGATLSARAFRLDIGGAMHECGDIDPQADQSLRICCSAADRESMAA